MTSVYKNLDGNDGPAGAQGPAGPGVPVGGVVGQVLIKNSSTNYDAYWGDLDVFSNYKTHEVDDASPVTYVGQIKATTGAWLIQEITQTGDDIEILYANESNNPSYATLATAFTDRASLNYDFINNLTGL